MISWLQRTLCVLGAVGGLGGAAVAAPVNGSFESGDFSGWQRNLPRGVSQYPPGYRAAGSATVVTSWARPFNAVAPVDGNYFAALGTAHDAYFTGQRTYHLSLSQSLWLNAGDLLSGWSAFLNGDCAPQDSAWVKIMNAGGVELAAPWREWSGGMNASDQNSTPYQTLTPWTRWEWQAPTSGCYTLALGVTTMGDATAASFGFFDELCLQPASPVPEPTAFGLFLIGTLLVRLRRRQQIA